VTSGPIPSPASTTIFACIGTSLLSASIALRSRDKRQRHRCPSGQGCVSASLRINWVYDTSKSTRVPERNNSK
jgi:hypothetical protein